MIHYSVPNFFRIEKKKTWFYLQYTCSLNTRAINFLTAREDLTAGLIGAAYDAGAGAVSGKPHFSFSIRDL